MTESAEDRLARLRARARQRAAEASDRADTPEERAEQSAITRALGPGQRRAMASEEIARRRAIRRLRWHRWLRLVESGGMILMSTEWDEMKRRERTVYRSEDGG
jgi:hypothetical protein